MEAAHGNTLIHMTQFRNFSQDYTDYFTRPITNDVCGIFYGVGATPAD